MTADRRKRVLVPVPVDPDDAWGPKQEHHVAGTVNGMGVRRHRATCFPAAGSCWDPWRRHCGIGPGDEVEVVLYPRTAARKPRAGRRRCAGHGADAAAFFDSLAQFYRRGYLRWIDATKRSPDKAPGSRK